MGYQSALYISLPCQYLLMIAMVGGKFREGLNNMRKLFSNSCTEKPCRYIVITPASGLPLALRKTAGHKLLTLVFW